MKRSKCEVCGHRDCQGWDETKKPHEYRKGNWFFGCHCPACTKARNEAGGFVGLIAELQKGGA